MLENVFHGVKYVHKLLHIYCTCTEDDNNDNNVHALNNNTFKHTTRKRQVTSFDARPRLQMISSWQY